MPVKAGGRNIRQSGSDVITGAGGDTSETGDAPVLPQPLRLKYSVGRIIGNIIILNTVLLKIVSIRNAFEQRLQRLAHTRRL